MDAMEEKLKLSAQQIVVRLLKSRSIRQLELASGIDRGQLSRISHGQRTNEENYRKLAKLLEQ